MTVTITITITIAIMIRREPTNFSLLR